MPIERLPAPEERQWLTHALKKVIARRRGEVLDAAPLVEPTNFWFPEPWGATAGHGHRLAQRLMHYAGMSGLPLSLSAYEPVWGEDEEEPWDASTAGWFAGFQNGRAVFGLNVDQFGDPEAAAGVLAHEVAHAWREHHHLIVDDRHKEELLTDVTTVVLGFGILSTNNTFRYRTWGNIQEAGWSDSAVGYLPPQAMSWLLALWCLARQRDGERDAIEKHLEASQLPYFRAAFEELGHSQQSARSLLGIASPPTAPPSIDPRAFSPHDPAPDEMDQPEVTPESEVNAGSTVYRARRGDPLVHVFVGTTPVFLIAWYAAMFLLDDRRSMLPSLAFATLCGVLTTWFMLRRADAEVCSDCHTPTTTDPLCFGCGGTLGRRVTMRELVRLREEEVDRLAQEEIPFEDCSSCAPEAPCAAHRVD